MSGERQREESFDTYPETVLAFEGGPRIDLRWRPGPEDRGALAALELGPAFAVLTTEDAGGEGAEAATADEVAERQRENVRRTLRFEEHLARAGVPFRRLDGSAPDGSHRERCVAVALPQEEAARLARERGQVALLWYDGERFWRWPAGAETSPRPPPPASEPPASEPASR
jgi:Protein of unknown function (DUF3293)